MKTLENVCLEILKEYHEGTRFEILAFELWGNRKEGYEVNDVWYLVRDADIPACLEAMRGRWEVFKVNYHPRAKVSAIDSTGEIPYSLILEVDMIPWLEIRPVA